MKGDKIMLSRTSMILVAIAGLLGLVLGYGLGENPTASILWALGLGIISVGATFYAVRRAEQTAPDKGDTLVHVSDPPLARFLFQDSRAAALWLPIRFYIGWDWFQAGWHKFNTAAWMDNSSAIRGFWTSAVAIPQT